MASKDDRLRPPTADLLRYLGAAQPVVGESFLPKRFRRLVTELQTRDQLVSANRDVNHPLWWFLPPIIYDLFDEKLGTDLLELEDLESRSIVVVTPPFLSITQQLAEELSDVSVEVTGEAPRAFSQRLIGLLYGGYPWFEAYLRICKARGLCDEQCNVLYVESTEGDLSRALEIFKKRRRHHFGQPLQMAFDDLPYPGLVRPFHAPSRIETTRHMRAAEVA